MIVLDANVVSELMRPVPDAAVLSWVDAQAAEGMMQDLRAKLPSLAGQTYGDFRVAQADDFVYTDPVDHSVATNQGIRIVMTDGSRVVLRLSGTGTEGATVRVYLERYEADPSRHGIDTQEALAPLIAIAEKVSALTQRTRRQQPSVIT